MDAYHTLLAADPNDEDSRAGAGLAAFELGQYMTAMQDFDRLPRERREQPDLANRFELTRQILAADPFLSGLSSEARAQRAANALALAQTRAETCARQTGQSLEQTPPQTDLQRLYQQSEETAKGLDSAIPAAIPRSAGRSYGVRVQRGKCRSCRVRGAAGR